MDTKQVIVNTIWYGIIPRITMLINIIILPFITPFLTPFDYGVYGIITSFSGFFSLVSVLGMNIHLTNSFYTHSKDFNKVWSRILTIILISSSFFSLLYGIILILALNEITGIVKIVTIISALTPILLQANNVLANHFYPLVYKPKPLVLRNILASIFGILVTFTMIFYLKLGFLGWIVGASVSSVISFFLFLKPLWINEKIFPSFSIQKRRLFHWLKISLPIIPHSLGFILLSSSDRIIMKILDIPINSIGIYSNGYQIGDYITIVTAAMITAVAPRIQELYRSSNFKKLRELFLFIQIITILSVFLFSIWMPQIYQVLIRNIELQEASSIAFVLCFANVVFPFYSFISTSAFIEEQTKKILWLVLLPGIINIILNFIFIPIFGFKAAVITTLVSYWFQLFIPFFIGYFHEKVVHIFGTKYFTILLFVIFLLSFIIAFMVVNKPIIIKIIISFLVLISSIIFIKRQKEF